MIGIDIQVGEVPSSFGKENVDIVTDIEFAVNEFARRYGTPDVAIYKDDPKLKDNPLEAAKHVEITGSDELIKDTETAVVAEIAKLQTAEENLKLNPKQKEVFEGYKQNQKGALTFISAMAGAIKNPNIRKKVISGTVATLEILGLAACGVKGLTTKTVESTPTNFPPVVETTGIPTEAPSETATNVPAGSETQMATEAAARSPVTAEDVKNVEPSLKIERNNEGYPTNLPEGTDYVIPFYETLANKFPKEEIFFNQDPATGRWILYTISPEGKLYNSIVSYDEGKTMQFNDYPVDFNNINGEYAEVDIPSGEVGVIWEESGLPQLLAGKTTLPNGDTIFTKFMEYKTYRGENPWQEVSGVNEVIEKETSTLSDTVHNLSANEMFLKKGVLGTGFEVVDKFQDKIPMDITIVLSKTIQDQYGRVRECKLNPKMAELDPERSAEERTQEVALLGFYMAYVRDHGYTENNYSFEKYIADLATGKDMSVKMFGKKLDGTIGEFETKPGVIEFIGIAPGTNSYGDPILTTSPAYLRNGYGYQELEGGGLRIVYTISKENGDLEFCSELSKDYDGAFGKMGHPMEGIRGDYKLYGVPVDTFPKTIDYQNNTVTDQEIWSKYKLSTWLLISP